MWRRIQLHLIKWETFFLALALQDDIKLFYLPPFNVEIIMLEFYISPIRTVKYCDVSTKGNIFPILYITKLLFLCFFAPCIVIQLNKTNQRNVQFYKLILNFWCLIQVSNPRRFILRYTFVYAVWYALHASVWTDWWTEECVRAHQTAHTDACKTYHIAYTNVSLRMNPRGFETCMRHQKLNINL